MTDRITYLYAAWFLVTAALGLLLIHQRAEVVRLRQLQGVLAEQIQFCDDHQVAAAHQLEDCETTRAAIQKTANACGEGWALCEKRWGGSEWR